MLPKGYTLHGRTLAAFQAALVVIALAVLFVHHFSIAAAPPTATVWIADQKTLKQVDPSVNQFIRSLVLTQKAEALNIDPSDGAVWALSNKHLLKFSATGTPLLDLDLKRLFPGFPDPKYFTLDPYDGSLWVASEKALLHLSPTGQALSQGTVPDAIQALGLDTDQTLWVLTEKQLLHLSVQGGITNSLTLKPYINDPKQLAVDGLGGVIWIGSEKNLLQFNLNNLSQPPVHAAFPGSQAAGEHEDDDEGEFKTEALGIHPVLGTLWTVGKNSLLRYDRNALYLGSTDLTPYALGKIDTLAFEPVSDSLWLGGKQALSRFTPSGAFVAKLPAEQGIDAIGIGPFTLRPTLSLLAPVDTSLTNNPRPAIRFGLGASCSGSPCTLVDVYLNSLSLTTDLNGIAVGPLFTLGNGEARYTPAARLPEGLNTLKATAKDIFGHSSDPLTGKFTIDTIPPRFLTLTPADGSTLTSATVIVSGQVDDPTASVMLRNAAGTVLNVGNATFSFSVALAQGLNNFTLTAQDPAGNAATIPYRLTLNNPPPSPVPPPFNLTGFTPFSDATKFLYTGPNPVQTGVNPAALDPRRIAVLRGKVFSRDGSPLSGVKITVVDHPESGQTQSRADGLFDLVANGGGIVTLRYEKSGYMTAQRQVRAPWQDYAWLPEAVLTPYDSQVTSINLAAPIPMQVARGGVVTDSDGTRQATVFFPQGTTATITKPDGTTQALTTLNVRATEYTVGPNGPMAMPAPLPPTSGYTYAVELSADEAVAVNSRTVRFNQPVILYVENFLNFPVGSIVPVGFYDYDRAAWIPSENGRVIKILSITGGLATLDTNGDGVADDPAQLASLGITAAERAQLASLYSVGKSLWRVATTHFTPWDPNFPSGPPGDAGPPPPPGPSSGDGSGPGGDGGPTGGGDAGPGAGGGEGDASAGSDSPGPGGADKPKVECGSVIECQNQVLGESARLVGTPFSLVYRSNRVLGRKAANTLSIPLSTTSVPASLKRIDLTISVAGQQFKQSFAPTPNQTYTFQWDGKDAYGRTLQGMQPVTTRISYVYDAVYYFPPWWARSFGGVSGVPVVPTIPARYDIILSRDASKSVSPRNTAWDARGLGLGGWSLDMHHVYDPRARIIYQGNGSRRGAYNIAAVIGTAAGNGLAGYGGDGGPAARATLYNPNGVAVDAQGNVFVIDYVNQRIRRIGVDGIITTVAGNGVRGFGGDGGPATAASLNYPEGIAIDNRGNLLIADTGNHRIRVVSPTGVISTVAGNGVGTFGGDDGPATTASLYYPGSVTVDAEGSLYIADSFNYRIRRVNPAGFINTLAGNGIRGFAGDGGPSAQASLDTPGGVSVDGQGNVYIADTNNHRIRKVSAAGSITTMAGNGSVGSSGDGGSATAASLYYPSAITMDPQGNLFVGTIDRVRRVSPTGKIVTTAGGIAADFDAGDGRPATLATFFGATGVALDPAGSLFVSDFGASRIRKVSSSFPGGNSIDDIVIPSEDGAELYIFDPSGRHLRTLNALTGALRYAFTYNTNGYLTHIQDSDGNVTTIERSGDVPTAIIATDGQRTLLGLDANGYLAAIANPAGETTRMSYTNEGLLTSFTTARGFASTMTYDSLGRLIREENPAGGFWALARTQVDARTYEASLTSALGRTTTYRVENLDSGGQRRVNTFPDGTHEESVKTPDGTRQTISPDGTLTMVIDGPDPRFGMLSPVPGSRTVQTPGGLRSDTYTTRTAIQADPGNPSGAIRLTDEIWRNGNLTTQVYDVATRQFTLTSPMGRQRNTIADLQGRVVQSQVTSLEAVNYAYDARGRLSTISQGTGADARTSAIAYNPQGFADTLTDPAGQTTRFSYDPAGRATRQTLPDGRIIAWSYDANGNVIGLTPPSKPTHTFGYTPVDLEERYTPPAVTGVTTPATQYAYNLDKQLTTVTRPDGQAIALGYDAAGKLSTITLPTGGIVLGYSANGQLASFNTTQGVNLSYTYDGFLPLSESLTGPVSGTVSRNYNSDFRTTGISVNGNAITLAYDADNLLTKAGALNLARNAQNGLLTATVLGSTTTAHTYNTFGELNNFQASHAGSGLYSFALTRDKRGNITQKTETVQGQTNSYGYSYDATGRLIEVTKNGAVQSSYSYDPNGNRLPGTYDDQDRLISQGTTTYTYTANGELKTKTQAGQTSTYTYDALGNLRQASVPGANDIEYVIDGRNRRVGKRTGATLVQGFLYQDGLRPIAELDGSGTVVSRFVYGSKFNVPDYLVMGDTTYRIISDHLGSPRLVINTSTGAIAQRLDYDEFGNVLQDTNPGFQPFGFAGGLYDRDTKLVRFGARDYDPETGRWTAKDPVRFSGGDLNLYGYVLNDPVNIIDPWGLSAFGEWLETVLGIGAGPGAEVPLGSLKGGLAVGEQLRGTLELDYKYFMDPDLGGSHRFDLYKDIYWPEHDKGNFEDTLKDLLKQREKGHRCPKH